MLFAVRQSHARNALKFDEEKKYYRYVTEMCNMLLTELLLNAFESRIWRELKMIQIYCLYFSTSYHAK